MPRRPKKAPNKKQMTLREQAAAIARVAKLSFKTAPGAVLFKLAGAVIEALLPIAIAYFAALTTTALVQAYNGDSTAQSAVLTYVVITAALGLFNLAWRSVDQYIQASMRYKVEARVSDQMYEQFLSLDFWRYDDKETADLYEKAQKFAQFFAWIFDRLANIISQLVSMIAGIGALYILNGWLALAILVAIVPGVYLQFRLSRAQIAHWNNNIDARRSKNMIEWNLLQPDSVTELRLYGIVRYLLDLRKKLRDKDEKARIEFERQFIGWRLGADTLQTLAEIGSLVWVTLEIIAHHQPVGQFIYVQQVVSRAISGATGFISELSTIDEDVANLFEYQQFMQLERPTTRPKKVTIVPNVIELKGVSFRYPTSENDVLHDISFRIQANEHVAIVGENGAGKSTLIKLITGIYEPTEGDVLLDEQPLREFDSSSWHRQLAVLKQDFTRYLFASARDNIAFGDVTKHDENALDGALTAAEAKTFIEKLPRGLESYLYNWMEDDEGNKGVEISGGQWQRVALARNFYRDAPIIILDEPTSAIDALAEARIFERLFKHRDKTIITISHRLTTVKKADSIYMMKDGRIVEQGTYAELLAKQGEFYKMFEAQL
jgi:ATP-binding cassette subfamily B protein/ATP-binding cassette subfamily C protein